MENLSNAIKKIPILVELSNILDEYNETNTIAISRIETILSKLSSKFYNSPVLPIDKEPSTRPSTDDFECKMRDNLDYYNDLNKRIQLIEEYLRSFVGGDDC